MERGHRLVAQLHDDRVAAGCGFRRDPLLGPAREHQQRAFRACVLDRGTHQRIEQLFEDHLARDGLRDLDHGREVELFERGADRASLSSAVSSGLRCG